MSIDATVQPELALERMVPVSVLQKLCEKWTARARADYPKHATMEDLCVLDLQEAMEQAV